MDGGKLYELKNKELASQTPGTPVTVTMPVTMTTADSGWFIKLLIPLCVNVSDNELISHIKYMQFVVFVPRQELLHFIIYYSSFFSHYFKVC